MSSTKSIPTRISILSLILYCRETRCTRCSSSRVAVISLPMRSKLPIKVENSSKKNSSCSFPSLQSRILSVTCHSERFQSHLSTSDLSRQQHFQMESVSARRKFQEPLQMLAFISEVVRDTIHQSPLVLLISPKRWL